MDVGGVWGIGGGICADVCRLICGLQCGVEALALYGLFCKGEKEDCAQQW